MHTRSTNSTYMRSTQTPRYLAAKRTTANRSTAGTNTAKATATLLLLVACAAQAAPLGSVWTLSSGWSSEDNFSRSFAPVDREHAHLFEVDARRDIHLPGEGGRARLHLGTRLVEGHPDLHRLELGLQAQRAWVPLQGYGHPSLSVHMGIRALAHADSAFRDRVETSVHLSSVTRLDDRTRLHARLGLRAAWARQDHVFDTVTQETSVRVSRDLDAQWQVWMGAHAQAGDLVANSSPSARIRDAARSIVRDTAFGPANALPDAPGILPPDRHAYRLRGWLAGVGIGANWQVRPDWAIDLSATQRWIRADGGLNYPQRSLNLTLLTRPSGSEH